MFFYILKKNMYVSSLLFVSCFLCFWKTFYPRKHSLYTQGQIQKLSHCAGEAVQGHAALFVFSGKLPLEHRAEGKNAYLLHTNQNNNPQNFTFSFNYFSILKHERKKKDDSGVSSHHQLIGTNWFFLRQERKIQSFSIKKRKQIPCSHVIVKGGFTHVLLYTDLRGLLLT